MDLSISGLASGFDWKTLVDALAEAERVPQTRLKADQSTLQQRNSAYGSLKSQLLSLKTSVDTLKDSALYDSRTVTNSDTSVATATVATGAMPGTYAFNIYQLATSASLSGQSDVGKAVGSAATTLAAAGFGTDITTGTFSINGKAITIDSTLRTLQEVFDSIKTATDDGSGGYIKGTYDADQDKIILSATGSLSGKPIVLSAPGDTSNFLAAAQLNYNDSGQVTSAAKLGAVKVSATLENANFATAVTGGSAGKFSINGVAITYDATQDSVTKLIARINASSAGVVASYDSVNDRFQLTNQATGDNGVALEDVQGNFLAASGLLDGVLQRGNNLRYSVNNSGILTSLSNTISASNSGITGLTVNALKAGTDDTHPATTNVTVKTDTAKIASSVNSFISAYNQTQSMIDSYTASSTDATGAVSAGVLAGQADAADIASGLRARSFKPVTGATGAITSLSSLGIQTSGYDNSLTLSDSATLTDALQNNLDGVRDFFTRDTTGMAARMSAFLDGTAGENGTLVTTQTNLTTQANSIDTQIANLERIVVADKERLSASFVAMETAQAKIQEQSKYLTSKFG